MAQQINRFDTVVWKREIFRQLLHPGGAPPKYEIKPPFFFYGGSSEIDTDQPIEIDLDDVGFDA